MKKAFSVLLSLCMLWSLMLTACVAEETKENDADRWKCDNEGERCRYAD